MNYFYETIFLKNDSSLEKKLEILKSVSSPNKEKIYMLEAGINGEKQVVYHMSKSNIGMFVMRDINLVCDDLKAQIDFVVVTSHHCYFIECKNYNADIIRVDEFGNFETSTKYGKRYNKMGIKSPISQVESQFAVFKKICLKDKENLTDKFNNYFRTMVVFTNPENRLDLKKAPINIKYRVLKVDNLIRQIEYDEKHSRNQEYSKDTMKQIADYILSKNVDVNVEDISDSFYTQQISNTDLNQALKSQNGLKREFKNGLKSLLIAFLVLAIIYFVYGNKNKKNNEIIKNDNKKISYPVVLNDNQKKALSIFNSAYYDSKENGFTIIHTSVCNTINYFFENDISCNIDPIEVNYNENNIISFYRPLSKTCYKLTLSDDGEKVVASEYHKVYDNSCKGNPMGMIEWDDNNEFFKKIGGYEEIKELAVSYYKEGPFNVYDFDTSQISKRGGDINEFSNYYMNINYYFTGVTGNGMGKKDTTKENFNKMVESYYYLMK